MLFQKLSLNDSSFGTAFVDASVYAHSNILPLKIIISQLNGNTGKKL